MPHLKTLGAVEAAGFLAALPKPLMAVSFVTNEQLYIATWSRDKPHGLYNDVVEMFREALGTVREEGMRPDLADVIVASSDSIGVPLSSAEFERWMFDYDIPFATLAIGPSSTSAIPRSMLTATISRQTGDWINDLPLP
ncbi:MAG: hypothetical protein ABJE47_20485 [bacterium]